MGSFHKDKKGYPRWNDSGKLVHRTVMGSPRGMVVHHKDGNKMNFRKGNLRTMTRSEHSTFHARKRR